MPCCSKTIDAGEIDAINILQAALKAMEGAATGLPEAPDFLLVDGNRLPKVRQPLQLPWACTLAVFPCRTAVVKAPSCLLLPAAGPSWQASCILVCCR